MTTSSKPGLPLELTDLLGDDGPLLAHDVPAVRLAVVADAAQPSPPAPAHRPPRRHPRRLPRPGLLPHLLAAPADVSELGRAGVGVPRMSRPYAACDDVAREPTRRDRAAGAVAGGFAVRRHWRPPLRLGPRGMVDLEGWRGGRTDTRGDGPRRSALRRPWLAPSRA